MSTVTKLRLVGAKRYMDARIRNSSAVVLGEEVPITDPEIAQQLLQVTFTDRYNEQSPMFEEVEEVEEEEAPKKTVKTVRKTTATPARRRKAAS